MRTYLVILLYVILAASMFGCSREFKDEVIVPNKITINSAEPSFDRVFLAWNYPDNYPTDNMGVYELYRATDNRCEVTPSNRIAIVNPTSNIYEDFAGLQENTTYYYRILYKDFFGNVRDISDVTAVSTISSANISFDLAHANGITITVKDCYPTVNYELYRATGNVSPLPQTALLVLAGSTSMGTTCNFIDSVSTRNPGTYTYQAYGTVFGSDMPLTSNLLVVTY